MNYLRFSVIDVVVLAIVLHLSCMNVPVAPDQKPENAKITLFETGDCGNITTGGNCRIGLMVQLGKHIDSILVHSSCGQESLSLIPDHSRNFDTLYFEPLFHTEGPCTLFAMAKLFNTKFADKKDTLVIDVYPPKATVSFTEKPDFHIIHAGQTDTLLFVTGVSGNAILPVNYSITSKPVLETGFLYPVFSAIRDSVFLILDRPPSDTYTITVEGFANVTSGEPVTDTALVVLRVYPSLSPLVIEAPQTVFTGEKDTLIFTVQDSDKADTVFIQLVDEESLAPDIGSIIPTSADSLIIVLSPERTGDLTLGVLISNGILSDTTLYQIAFMNRDSALWYQTETEVSCTEGTGVTIDIKEFFIRSGEDDVTFVTDIGSISDDTIWTWTPPWGTAVSLTATVTAQKGDLSIPLLMHLAVKPGDDDAPAIRLADKSLDGKTVGSPQITVTCIATDEGAGVDKVYILFRGMATEAVLQNDSIYAGVVSGLVHNRPTKITLAASDRSIAKNSTTSSFTVTYDSTKQDDQAPVITYHSGPQSGDRVTEPEGTVVYIVNDPAGIDSVWWTLNSEYIDELSIVEDGAVQLSYTLEEYGENVITIFATDDTKEHNKGSSSFTLHFNTTLSAISGTSPENSASDVGLTPVFTWSGGEDDDGDDVYFRVFYGLTNQTMPLSTGETREQTVTITSANSLTPSTTYFWQVTAWSKAYPDTVRSNVLSFTTRDSMAEDATGPTIAVQSGPDNGSTVTHAEATFTIRVSDVNDVDSVYAALNDGAKAALLSTGDAYIYSCSLTNGQNCIEFEAVDQSSNRNRSTLQVNVTCDPTANDEDGPLITIESGPQNGSTVSSNSGTFTLIVTDESGVDSVYATLDNRPKTSLISEGSNRYSFPCTFSEGDNNIVFEAVDNATGRNRSTHTVTVTYDPTADDETGPTISIETGPGNGARITDENVTFVFEVTDESGVDSVYATLNSGTQRVVVMSGTDTYDYQCTAVYGDNTVLFAAVDQASGRNRSTRSVTFNYNTTISAVAPATPADNATDVATLPHFSWTGGNDPDGDDVFFRLSLGTSVGTYSVVINDITGNDYQLTSAHTLSNSLTYYWMVTAYSGANSDETSSSERSFTTTPPAYSLIYHANGGIGNVPVDGNGYQTNDEAVVEGNTGNLSRSNRTFIGWNTDPDGSGTTYQEDDHVTFNDEDITLYAKWRINEGLLYASYTFSGNAHDMSDNNHDATVEGATLTEDRHGNLNCAYYFNGEDNIHFDNMSDFPAGNVPRTICGWFYSTFRDSSYIMFFGFGRPESQYNFQVGSGVCSGYQFRVNGWNSEYDWCTGIDSPDYLDGTGWHHCAVTYDGTITTLYIDGQALGETDQYQYFTDPDNMSTVIGLEVDLSGWGFVGALDDIRIYTGALSADQILEIYNE